MHIYTYKVLHLMYNVIYREDTSVARGVLPVRLCVHTCVCTCVCMCVRVVCACAWVHVCVCMRVHVYIQCFVCTVVWLDILPLEYHTPCTVNSTCFHNRHFM